MVSDKNTFDARFEDALDKQASSNSFSECRLLSMFAHQETNK